MAEVRCKETTEELFDEIIIMAMERGIKFGKLHVVDSVHTITDVNLNKDEGRKREDRAQSSSY